MDIKKLFQESDSLINMERYINDGSPSGFTEIHTTSDKTNPFRGIERFPLLEFSDEDLKCHFLGEDHKLLNKNVNYAHPDSIVSEVLKKAGRKLRETNFTVSPTSSGRTMMIRDGCAEGYIKLTYDVNRIGRVDRQLSKIHCLSSYEVTKVLKEAMANNKLSKSFALLLDDASKITELKFEGNIFEWGVITRKSKPFPYKDDEIRIIPGFTLISKDRNNPEDEFVINQIIELSSSNPKDYLINLIKMIIDGYWTVVINCALNLECHAQNCLFEIDKNYNIQRFVYRDMDSVDKDIPLARHFGYKTNWESKPYLCMDESIYYYNIRSSYMYDFKLGEYLLEPLVNIVCQKFQIDQNNIYHEIREYVNSNYLKLLPKNYFTSDGYWYKCDNTERLPGQKRKYYKQENPLFR